MEEAKDKLKLSVILTALETDKQQLADEIGEDRAVVSKVLSGNRKATGTRRKLAKAICTRIEALIIPAEPPTEQTAAKGA
ncbi:MAG TPA: hypothetical protein VGB07_36295 [Blastocatellia bacterium]